MAKLSGVAKARFLARMGKKPKSAAAPKRKAAAKKGKKK